MIEHSDSFEVRFYKDRRGNEPVQEYLEQMPTPHLNKALKAIHLLQELGPMLRRPWSDLLRDKIYELRPGYGSFEHRILYFFSGKVIVMTHGFLKKTQQIPENEIDFAINCRLEWVRHKEELEL